jgi:hypothetical protein
MATNTRTNAPRSEEPQGDLGHGHKTWTPEDGEQGISNRPDDEAAGAPPDDDQEEDDDEAFDGDDEDDDDADDEGEEDENPEATKGEQ